MASLSLTANPLRSGGELGKRVASALVMVPLALGAAVLGGWPFALFWFVAAAIVFYEFVRLCGGAPGWITVGAVYAAAILIAPVLLRGDLTWGLTAILFLFAVVWATDIVAYFVGRAFGGPKLSPRFSPKKTWSGAVGGLLGGAAAGIAVAATAQAPNLPAIAAVALLLSVVAQAGDILESAFKRRFGAKDSGALIPGHGGLLDRLDGFAVAVIVALAIGAARGGFAAPARGLLVW